ncbi:MAG TPA: hypothetical protein VEL31_05735 [Ktedonobacteraceae bacterium]|nr:hypothetical protein [Ktedonobacteraceae bacterium]
MRKSEEKTQQLQSIQAKMDAVGPAYQNGSQKAKREMATLTEEYKQTYRERATLKKQEQKG